MGKLSHELLDLGFFSALGTWEESAGKHVGYGTPFTSEFNNGVTAVYDEAGRPWIIGSRKLNDGRGLTERAKKFRDVFDNHSILRGARVPHSNDGGVFVRTVLAQLMPDSFGA